MYDEARRSNLPAVIMQLWSHCRGDAANSITFTHVISIADGMVSKGVLASAQFGLVDQPRQHTVKNRDSSNGLKARTAHNHIISCK